MLKPFQNLFGESLSCKEDGEAVSLDLQTLWDLVSNFWNSCTIVIFLGHSVWRPFVCDTHAPFEHYCMAIILTLLVQHPFSLLLHDNPVPYGMETHPALLVWQPFWPLLHDTMYSIFAIRYVIHKLIPSKICHRFGNFPQTLSYMANCAISLIHVRCLRCITCV